MGMFKLGTNEEDRGLIRKWLLENGPEAPPQMLVNAFAMINPEAVMAAARMFRAEFGWDEDGVDREALAAEQKRLDREAEAERIAAEDEEREEMEKAVQAAKRRRAAKKKPARKKSNGDNRPVESPPAA